MARARSLSEFQTSFPDETSCAAFLFQRRWPEGFVCPACGNGCGIAEEPGAHLRMPRLRSLTDGHRSYPGLADYRHDPRTVGKMAGHVVLPWIHRVFALMKRWGLGTYHGLRRKHVDTYLNEFVFRYNRRFYRHVSFETMLGLASHHHPTSYWDIVGRDNPRKGVPTVRRQPRRRRTATGMQQDGSSLPQNSRASTASGAPLLKR